MRRPLRERLPESKWSWSGAVLGMTIAALLAVIGAVQLGIGPDAFWIAVFVLMLGLGFFFGGKESLAWLPWR